mmetsp:Transcript_128/g.448  ORF Transcript_128/g.448 Transcript_128/m.448 type:complete len:228 (-) Transcript_128:100-783(-)
MEIGAQNVYDWSSRRMPPHPAAMLRRPYKWSTASGPDMKPKCTGSVDVAFSARRFLRTATKSSWLQSGTCHAPAAACSTVQASCALWASATSVALSASAKVRRMTKPYRIPKAVHVTPSWLVVRQGAAHPQSSFVNLYVPGVYMEGNTSWPSEMKPILTNRPPTSGNPRVAGAASRSNTTIEYSVSRFMRMTSCPCLGALAGSVSTGVTSRECANFPSAPTLTYLPI